MVRHKISHTSLNNYSKFFFDKQYIIFIMLFCLLFSSVLTIIDILNWEKNILYYFNIEKKIDNLYKPSFYHILILLISSYITTLIPALILRFCVGITLIKSQIKVQRFTSFIITLLFIFTSQRDGFGFGDLSNQILKLHELSNIMNYIFLGFFLISISIFFVNSNEKQSNRKARISIIFTIIIGYLIFDWKSTKDFRINSIEKVENSEIIFIFEKSSEKNLENMKKSVYYEYIKENFKEKEILLQLISNNTTANYATLFSGLFPFESGIRTNFPSNSSIIAIQNYIKNNKYSDRNIFVSNIAMPSSTGGLIKSFDGGITCDNSINSFKKLSIIKNLNSIINFIPKEIIIKSIPDIFCLSPYRDISNSIATGIYHTLKTTNKNKNIIINILDENTKENSVLKIIERINETFSSENLNISIIFIGAEKNYGKILSLNKKILELPSIANLINFSNKKIISTNKDREISYSEELKQNVNNYKLIDNRVTSINENILSLTEKRKYICENSFVFADFENKNQELPQKIYLYSTLNKNTKKCYDFIKESFKNDVNININEELFDKLFTIVMEKI